MTAFNFNAEAQTPRFTYRPSPVHPRGYMIFRHARDERSDPHPVGDYIVLDTNEDPALSEKKLNNLISLLNGRKALMQLGHESGTRVLYSLVSECDDDGKMRILFYTLGHEGVSVENALFRLERESYDH